MVADFTDMCRVRVLIRVTAATSITADVTLDRVVTAVTEVPVIHSGCPMGAPLTCRMVSDSGGGVGRSRREMHVFLCWSGAASHPIAHALHGFLGDVIQDLEPFLSSERIRTGKSDENQNGKSWKSASS